MLGDEIFQSELGFVIPERNRSEREAVITQRDVGIPRQGEEQAAGQTGKGAAFVVQSESGTLLGGRVRAAVTVSSQGSSGKLQPGQP